MYTPLNYNQINAIEGTINPSQVKSYNNKSFVFWERSLFQRACSVLKFENIPEEWNGNVKDFLLYCLYKYGFVAVFEESETGLAFQPCTLSGFNFYYQPTEAIVSNPLLQKSFTIGDNCELLKLTPDYMGVWDIITYYAEKLSLLDNSLNMSLINNKFAYVLGARNKTAGEALKKIMDKINRGEPTVIYDMKLLNDPQDKAEPWQFLERTNIKQSYITTDLLNDFRTILDNFDKEIGIPTVPYHKKERLVESEAESGIIDATSRSSVWFETITSCLKKVNEKYNTNITVTQRYIPEVGGVVNG